MFRLVRFHARHFGRRSEGTPELTMESVSTQRGAISAIVPTIGRPESLRRMLESLCVQSHRIDEVIIADGSSNNQTRLLIEDPRWGAAGLALRRVAVSPPNAVRQRENAIRVSVGDILLFLDDDVVLEQDCVEHMHALLQANPNVVAVTADFTNQRWPQPTRLWQLYLRYALRLPGDAWQGRVVGPLLRFGYNPVPASPKPMQWLGSGNSMVKRSAYSRAGGFSDFFLHRCTINEDVDLGIKLARVGRILFNPAARMAHHQAPEGRVPLALAVEDDLHNRFLVMHRTLKFSKLRSLLLVLLYVSIESVSNILGATQRLTLGSTLQLLRGRVRGLIQIGRICFRLPPRQCP
jgi:GT2 family glycosyltransferase